MGYSRELHDEVQSVVERAIEGLVRGTAGTALVIRVLLDCMRNLNVLFCEQVIDLAIQMKASKKRGTGPDGTSFLYSDFIVGMNLAGDEINFPNSARPGGGESFQELFKRKSMALREAQLGFAPHAGEPKFPETVADCDSAFELMGARRVGHGYHCSETRWELVAGKGLHIEACPASSMSTGAVSGPWEQHPIRRMIKLGVRISLNTDDRAVIGTSMTEQLELARLHLGFSLTQIVQAAMHGLEASFVEDLARPRLCSKIKTWWQDAVATRSTSWLSAGMVGFEELGELIEYLSLVRC